MNKQHTFSLRVYAEHTKTISEEQCAETRGINFAAIWKASQPKRNNVKPARNEKKSSRRKTSKAQKKVKPQWFKQIQQNLWKCYSKHQKTILKTLVRILLLGILLYLNPEVKEALLNEMITNLLK